MGLNDHLSNRNSTLNSCQRGSYLLINKIIIDKIITMNIYCPNSFTLFLVFCQHGYLLYKFAVYMIENLMYYYCLHM